MRSLLIVVVGFLASAPVMAICLNPFGCDARTLAECRDDASRRPTDAGVKVALQECQRVEYERREAAEKKLLQTWRAVAPTGDRRRISEALGLQIHSTSSKEACSATASGPGAKDACTHIRWRLDDKAGKARFLHLIVRENSGAFDWFSPEPLGDFPEMTWRLQ